MGRINSLQGLRFIFILLIVLEHTVPGFGSYGVAFFFMLSGFVLTWAYWPRIEASEFSTKRLLVHQLKKFYPLYILLYFVFIALDAVMGIKTDTIALIVDPFLLQSWFLSDGIAFAINGPAWFLCNIMFCYLVFKPLAAVLMRGSSRRCVAFIVLLLLLYIPANIIVPDDKVNSIIYVNPLYRLVDFILGIALCRFCRGRLSMRLRDKFQRRRYSGWMGCLVMFVLLMVVGRLWYDTPARVNCAALFWPFYSIIIWVAFVTDRPLGEGRLNPLVSSGMQWLGSLTIEIYLIHALVIRVFNHFAHSIGLLQSSLFLHYVVLYAAILLTAYLAKRFFVAPITRGRTHPNRG